MAQRRDNARIEKILLAAACGLFAVLVALSVTLTVVFYRYSEKHGGDFDIGMITSDGGEYEDISGLFIPSFIGITHGGDRSGTSCSSDVTADIFRTLSPTVAYILSRNSVTEVGEDDWESLVSLGDSVYIRFHSEMPASVVGMFAGMLAQSRETVDVTGGGIYEMFIVPYSAEGDIIRLLTRSVDGEVMQYTAFEPEKYITSAELGTIAESYSSSLIDFSFAKNEYSSLGYTEPLFSDTVRTANIIVTNGTSVFAYNFAGGVDDVMSAFGMNPDKVRISREEDTSYDYPIGYIDSRGAFYVRDSGFEYRSTADGGIEMSRYTGYIGGDGYSLEDCIRAAAGLFSSVSALDRYYGGGDADVYLSSVAYKNGSVTVELSYRYDNIPFTGMPPALSVTFRDGMMRQATFYTVAVRRLAEYSETLSESGFALYLASGGASAYNITLKYRADYSSESVRAEWFGESDDTQR